MFINKQKFIYLILIIFSIYCTGILAADCDIYKKIVGNNYDEELEEVNGNCCELKKVKCDLHNNITYA